MLPKVFRLIALFFFVALILSPIYFKHIHHYVRSIDFTINQLENITESVLKNKIADRYICNTKSFIDFQSNERKIQVIHFSSPKCFACISEVNAWRKLPLEVYNLITLNTENDHRLKVEIINVISKELLYDKNTEDFLSNIMTLSVHDQGIYEKIASSNISTCITAITNDEMKKMNIAVIPYSLIIKNGEIIYSFAGQINNNVVSRLSNIINNNINY